MANKSNIYVRLTLLIILNLTLINTGIHFLSLKKNSSQEEHPSQSVNVSNTVNKNNKFNILVLGLDKVANLTDVILIVSYDTVSRSMNVLQIPRDTYAEYTSASYRKINAATDILNGGRQVANFIEHTLCIAIDRYVIIDIDTIAEIVDAVGGVEIDVPQDMKYSDPYQNLDINIKKGMQLMDGQKAVKFLRYREGYTRGDLDRLDAQKLFMAAFLKKIANNGTASLFTSIADKVLNKLESDITYKDCFHLFVEVGMPSIDKIYFSTLPGCDVRSSSGTWYYIMNRRAAFEIIKEQFNPRLEEVDFDCERKFTNSIKRDFNEIYEAQNGYEAKIYSADQLIKS